MRTTSDPVLYICPASSLHAQLLFNLRNFKIMVVRDMSLTDPPACAVEMAASSLYRPGGSALDPIPDACDSRLNSLLLWHPATTPEHAVVTHDPVLGLPVAII